MSHASGKAPKARKTLVEQAGEINIRDPAQHTRHQVNELDKQAKSSMMKRKSRLEQIDVDNKEIAHINDEIRSLRVCLCACFFTNLLVPHSFLLFLVLVPVRPALRRVG